MKRKRIIFIIGILIGAGFLMGSLFGKSVFVDNHKVVLEYPNEATSPTSEDNIATQVLSLQEAYNRIAEKNMPAVVSLHVKQTIVEKQNPFGFFEDDEFFRRFFGLPEEKKQFKRKNKTYGTGFVITKDGYLISNFHVVKNADFIKVVFKNGKEYEAKIIGTDPDTDIALLKIEKGQNFPTVFFGDSKKVKIGDLAVAIGNPFGLSHTFTSGVISAKGRSGMGNKYENYLQTDVAINPGNSGGPLLDIAGKVIGINTMIYSQTGGNIGIGFAIPINMVKSIIDQLVKNGKVIRGWLGISIQDISDKMAKDLDIDKNGIYVPEVVANSPAEKGGLKAGDIILEYAGKAINNSQELVNQVGNTPPGTQVNLKILRKNRKQMLTIMIEEAKAKQSNKGGVVSELLGVTLKDSKKGVQIEELTKDSLLGEKGVRPGDVIRMVDYSEVESVNQLKQYLEELRKSKKIILHIQRVNYLRVVVIYPKSK